MATTSKEELSIFLNEHIASSQDLNLGKVKSLLDLRRTEQVELDDKVSRFFFCAVKKKKNSSIFTKKSFKR